MNWWRVFKIKQLVKNINKSAGTLTITIESINVSGNKVYVTIFHMHRSPIIYTIDYEKKTVKWDYTQMNRDWLFTEAKYCNNMVLTFKQYILKEKMALTKK